MEKVSNKRWGYVVAGTIILLFAGLIYVWSLYKVPLNTAFPDWTPSNLSLVFTISIICFCLGGFLGGRFSKKMSHKTLILLAAAFLFVGYMVSSMISGMESGAALAVLIVFYGIICGLGSGFCYNAVLSSVVKWFPEKAATVSGIMLFGFGAGSLVLGSVISMLIASGSVFDTLRYIAIAVVIVLVIGAFVIKVPKGEAAAAAKSVDENKKQYTPGQMLKSPSFWLFFIWVVLGNASGLLVINSAANIAEAFGLIALLGMLVSVMNGGGRIFYGFMFDKFGRKVCMTLNSILLLVSGILLVTGGISFTGGLVLVGMLVVGLAYSCSPTASAAFTRSSYGSLHYAENFGVVNFSLIPAAIIGPMIAGSLFESSGGSYDSTFLMVIIFAVAAIIINFILGVAEKKEGLGK